MPSTLGVSIILQYMSSNVYSSFDHKHNIILANIINKSYDNN